MKLRHTAKSPPAIQTSKTMDKISVLPVLKMFIKHTKTLHWRIQDCRLGWPVNNNNSVHSKAGTFN